jgi:Ca2+-binding EF-hand superfamily protein
VKHLNHLKKQNIEANNFDDGEIRHLQSAEIKRIFLMVDKEDKGFIYTDELELLLLALNMNMVPSEVSKVIAACDTDNTGKIQFTDFFSWWYQDQDRQ